MVKARIITGSEASRQSLATMLRPFVYRKYLDYRVFDGLATLKAKIDAQAKSRGMRVNIKVGQGGIREIEFFVQAFQILRGGRNHQLQCSGIFDSFEALREHEIVDSDSIDMLHAAYSFLRLLENRIQMFNDQQTHDLPDSPGQQRRIAATMDFDDWDAVLEQLQRHRQQVGACFNDLFKQEDSPRAESVIDDSFDEGIEDGRQWDFIENSGEFPDMK